MEIQSLNAFFVTAQLAEIEKAQDYFKKFERNADKGKTKEKDRDNDKGIKR